MTRSRWKLASIALCLFCALGADDCEGAAEGPAVGPFAAEAPRYLPLDVGLRWVLRNPKTDTPVRVEVVRREGAAFVVEFENPWSSHEYRLVPDGGRIYRVDRDPGQPGAGEPALLWDFSAKERQGWQNALGRMYLTERNGDVRGANSNWTSALQIKQDTPDGNVLFWTFAPDVGLVQFGAGEWAFVLDPSASILPGSRVIASPATPLGDAVKVGEGDSTGGTLGLEVGRRWVLRSERTEAPVRLEVMRREGDEFVVEFENPWSFHEYRLVEKGARVYRTDRDPGVSGTGPELLWDLGDKAERWSNELGRMQVRRRGHSVTTPSGRYANALQIEQRTPAGDVLFWTFAPGAGLVQFGEGDWTFLLQDVTPGAGTKVPGEATAKRAPIGEGRVLLGLAATLPPTMPLTLNNRIKRFEMTLGAGVTLIYLSPKWDEIEPSKGRYNWNEVDFWVTQAKRHGTRIVLNLRIVDTGNVPRPSNLVGKDWGAPEVRAQLFAAIDAVVPRLDGTVRYFLLGNEISSYFQSNRGEADDYTALWKAAAARIRELVPGARVSASVTFDGLDALKGPLRELDQDVDYLALTYYPLKSDFTMRPPVDVEQDFRAIERAARGRPILLQEVGYSSSPTNRSSPEQQAAFYGRVFDELGRREGQIIGANFLWMSDLSDDVVEGFAKYYRLPGAENFKSYIKYLGIFDDQDRPKPAWDVFRKRGPELSR